MSGHTTLSTCVWLCVVVRQLVLDGGAQAPAFLPLLSPTNARFRLSLVPEHRCIVSKPLLVSGEPKEKAKACSLNPLPWYPMIPAPFFKALKLTCQPLTLPKSQCSPAPSKTHPHEPSV